MEAYDAEYVEHNLPLVFISGLADRDPTSNADTAARQESGTRLTSKSPECKTASASQLHDQLLEHDGCEKAWNPSSLPGPTGPMKYRLKFIGRTFTLPPRKAAPMAISPSSEQPPSTPISPSVSSTAFHSPISPISPGSPIYPDGIFTPLWMSKHQHQVPALIISCFDISRNMKAIEQEQIQNDINNMRTALVRSGFRTRFAAVLLGENSILDAPELDERIAGIRRTTSLDPRTGLFFIPPVASQAEVATLVRTMLSTLQPLCVEYYRDLTKHARRKKSRGGAITSASSTAGAGSLSLPTSGWMVRYDVKQGVFAEFRQEMDGAERHYSSAIEELFKDDGLLETTPSWAPRWSQARLLCDILALRVVRCQLWMNLTSGAVESWSNYHAKVKDLVDRRGKGSETYAWATWEARWARIMGELVQRAQFPGFQITEESLNSSAGHPAWLLGERPSDRLQPFYNLHRPGYWFRLALKKTRDRRQRALLIEEEDRVPPSRVPASAAANRNRKYDLYLARQPHEEHPQDNESGYDWILDITMLTEIAVKDLNSAGQKRTAAQVSLELGRDLVAAKRYQAALSVLKPLWQDASWRLDGWNQLLAQLLPLVRKCAWIEKDVETTIMATWESLGICAEESQLLDIARCLGPLETSPAKLSLSLDADSIVGPIRPSFAFLESKGHVGEAINCQIGISSTAPTSSTPITLSKIQIKLNGGRSVMISHSPEIEVSKEALSLVDLSEETETNNGAIETVANLCLLPHQTKIFNLDVHFREAENVQVESAILSLSNERFSIDHVYGQRHLSGTASSYVRNGASVMSMPVRQSDPTSIQILPKPPKLGIELSSLASHCYTDESMQLQVTLLNEESEMIEGIGHATLLDVAGNAYPVNWVVEGEEISDLTMAGFAAKSSQKATIVFKSPSEPGELSLSIEAQYTLSSDPDTPLVKTHAVAASFVTPFEARFEFGPQFQEGTWPSYFEMADQGGEDDPAGISHRWRLGCHLRSLAADDLTIEDMVLTLQAAPVDAQCKVVHSGSRCPHVLLKGEHNKSDFGFTTQKLSLDDRRPSVVELLLEIDWKRSHDGVTSTSTIPVPRLTLPSSEPRVLLTASVSESDEEDLKLEYHLENPSLHFLTFALTMEASNEFAFDGPKYRQLSLAPLSRYRVDYSLLLHDRKTGGFDANGARVIRPVLQVLDSYYQKSLKTHPGGRNVGTDEKGIFVSMPLQGMPT